MSSPARATSPLEKFARSAHAGERALWFRFAIDYFFAVDAQEGARTEALAAQMIETLGMAGPGERLAVVQQLSLSLRAPAEIFEAVADMGGEPAAYVLSHCAALGDARVCEAAAGDMAAAVAQRGVLPRAALDRLIRHSNVEAPLALAQNPIVSLSPTQFAAIVARAAHEDWRAGDPRLAQALLRRGAIALEHGPLFFAADSAQRVAILAAARRIDLGRPGAVAGPISRPGQIDALDRLAMDADDQSFVAELAEALGCDEALAARIADEPSGDALALALTALKARDDVIVRILVSRDLTAPGARSRVGALSRFRGVLTPQVAARMVAAIRGDAAASARATPRPQLDPTAAPVPGRAGGLAAAASPAVERRRKAFAFAFAAGRRNVGEVR